MKIRPLLHVIVCALLLVLVSFAANVEAKQSKSQPTKIGVLADLTDGWSTLGKNTVAALQVAANQIAAQTHGRQQFQLLIRDTQLDPSKALDAITELNQR